ncbi:MAG: tRNA threonylcarbamoyladenosine dehydratase [Bacteroidia bacterium]|nr:MAG: tRNA threonylcarbamoyladenosine dehydratase [Bacteroidia bacterium]
MQAWQERTQLLIGDEGIARLRQAHVLVAGLGGVGGAAAETLARAGVGRLTIADADTISVTNINRQLLATHRNIGQQKARVAGERLLSINPRLELEALDEFLRDDRLIEVVRMHPYSAIIDAIDTLSPKIYLIKTALETGVPLVSSMGAAGKLDHSQVRTGPFWGVEGCHLARTLRKRFRRMGVLGDFTAVYSTELADPAAVVHCEEEQNKKSRVGVISYLPNLFGVMAGAHVVQTILRGAEQP